jgi:hypothetical protein
MPAVAGPKKTIAAAASNTLGFRAEPFWLDLVGTRRVASRVGPTGSFLQA